MKEPILSVVPGFEGPCKPVWLNKNQIDFRVTGGISGFFRLVKKIKFLPIWIMHGEEFHGIIRNSTNVVESLKNSK